MRSGSAIQIYCHQICGVELTDCRWSIQYSDPWSGYLTWGQHTDKKRSGCWWGRCFQTSSSTGWYPRAKGPGWFATGAQHYGDKPNYQELLTGLGREDLGDGTGGGWTARLCKVANPTKIIARRTERGMWKDLGLFSGTYAVPLERFDYWQNLEPDVLWDEAIWPSSWAGETREAMASVEAVVMCTKDPVYAVGCSACEAGTVPPFPGSQDCVACGVGTYTETKGVATCQTCQAGFETRRRRAKSCVACPAGRYQDKFLQTQDACKPCPAGHFSAAGAAVCSACPNGRFADDEGQSACKNCPDGTQSFTAATSCFGDCPCGKEFKCSCSFGEQLSYNVTVPVQEKGTQYQVRMKFLGAEISSCRFMDQPLTELDREISCNETLTDNGRTCLAWEKRLTHLEPRLKSGANESQRTLNLTSSFCRNPDNSSTIWCYVGDDNVEWEFCQPKAEVVFQTTLRLLGQETADLRLSGDRDSCRGLQEFSVLHPMKATWGSCRQGARDTWRFMPVAAAPGRALLQFTGNGRQQCAGMAGEMLDCYEHDLNQLVPMDSLHESISRWTMKEHGQKEHLCGVDEHSTCYARPASSDALQFLVSLGKLGDPVGQHFISKIQLKNTSTPSQFRYSYWMSSLVFRPQQCYDLQTTCTQAKDSELYQLEAHRVQCASGQAMQSVAFKACGAKSYQYEYRCCDVEGMGGCELELTPWTKREPSGHGRIEAKDPGESKSEVRYLFTCCQVTAHEPMSVVAAKDPIPQSYTDFEGNYFPTSRVEGRLLYEAFYHFSRDSVGSVQNFSFDPFKGHWCLFYSEEAKCVAQGSIHPLQLIPGLGDPFEVKSLGPIRSQQEPGAPMKELKIVKFKTPPRMTQRKLEKLELEEQAMDHFTPSKEMTTYDLDMVENWMPSVPNYRPYCALRDPKQWESLHDLEDEESSGWGVEKRLEELNLDANRDRIGAVLDLPAAVHPCYHYFLQGAGIKQEPFQNDFDRWDYLSFGDVAVPALKKASTAYVDRQKDRRNKRREDEKAAKEKVQEMEEDRQKQRKEPKSTTSRIVEGRLAHAGIDIDAADADEIEKVATSMNAEGGSEDLELPDEVSEENYAGATTLSMEKCAWRREVRLQKHSQKEMEHDFKQTRAPP
ncbi:LPAL2 [Symbiodinium sp. CCMP2456]|nr:LPAL2 [Symbiodinium sp. CCMP2456]